MQRRAAVALLAFVVVAGALGLGVYAVGGQPQKQEAIKSAHGGAGRVRRGQDRPRERQRTRRRPHQRRPQPRARAAQRRVPAADRRRERGLPDRADRPAARDGPRRPRPPVRRDGDQVVAAVHLPQGQARPADGPRPRLGRGALRARHAQQDRVAHRPRQEDGLPGPQVRPADVLGARRRPEVPDRRRPRRPRPRHQEPAVALAAREQLGSRHAGPHPGQELVLVGRRRQGLLDLRRQLRRRLLQALRRRPVRAEHHGPRPRQRRLGLPQQAGARGCRRTGRSTASRT